MSGTQSSFSSDGVPGTPDSLMSDSVLGTSDDFDFDTDVDYCSTDSEQEPNETEVTSFEGRTETVGLRVQIDTQSA